MRIALLTSNHHKAQEFAAALGSHGQKLVVVPLEGDIVDVTQVKDLLADGHDLVVREQAMLLDERTRCLIDGDPADMAVVINRSTLVAYGKSESFDQTRLLKIKDYEAEVRGFIDMRRRVSEVEVFGWDDIFIPIDGATTFQDMKAKGIKVSARQLNIGRFLADYIHFATRKDMRFFPMQQQETVEFSSTGFDFVTTNPLIVAGTEGHYLGSILSNVLSAGIFFRSAATRQEKNYWLPGLNAGIPLTEKKDPIHEITFLFHDLMHFQLPDLIPDVGGKIAKDVYVTHRVMGEALTLVLADMVFVDNMRRNGIDYDFSKRLIYPLYQNMDVGGSIDGLRNLVKAMALYAVRGDDSLLRSLLMPGAEAEAALVAFKEKYGRFFEEDLRWTQHNFDQFESQGEYIGRWIDHVVGRESLQAAGLETLSSFLLGLGDGDGKDLFAAVFEKIFDRVVKNARTSVDADPEACVSNAFKRYMIGQLSIFARFRDVLDAPAIREKLMAGVASQRTIGAEEIQLMRGLFDVYVEMLERRSLINHSESLTYRSMHPVFPPFYVFYDAKKASVTPQVVA